MARDTTDNTPLETREQLVRALSDGCKPKNDWRIGTEHEKFGFYRDDYSPVPYEGERGIGALLTAICSNAPAGSQSSTMATSSALQRPKAVGRFPSNRADSSSFPAHR